MPPEVAWPEGGITMDYPSYPPVIPNAFFAYPWYGYSGNSVCYGSGLQQATQQANIQQLNSRILELQMQQCCCNQITALNNRLSDMVNAAQFQRVLEPKRPKNFVYELDKILFPDNPIRDYIQEEIRKIKEKYAERIKKLDALLA